MQVGNPFQRAGTETGPYESRHYQHLCERQKQDDRKGRPFEKTIQPILKNLDALFALNNRTFKKSKTIYIRNDARKDNAKQ